MSSIRVQERTSIDDVLTWQFSSCNEIRVTRRSGFEPGAQGLALSSLASLNPHQQVPVLECEFEEPASIDELESTLLGSAFGFAFARFASQIRFSGKGATAGFKPLLGELYKARQGVLGTGSTRSIVCPDPIFTLPPVMAHAGSVPSPEYFPAPSAFTALLNSIVATMGFRRLLASTEESSIVSFVYEALRNSWEHGLPSEGTRRARSTRALILEKIVLQGKDLKNRQFSTELKLYLERVAEGKRNLGLGVICCTVADIGEGIQATLPAKDNLSGETPAQRLARAFLPGESRKPSSVVKRGLGLPSVVSAAHNLQALMRIRSGNLLIGQDFSIGEDKYPRLNFETMRELPADFLSGTTVSIYVPEFAFDLDQRSLFPG